MKNLIRILYVRIFSFNYLFSKINDFILILALSAKGYNNSANPIESGESFFIKRFLSKKDIKLCIDVGANNGSYSLQLLKDTKAKVISFEPLPFMYDEMVKNLQKYKNRCIFVNKSLGIKSEEKIIHFSYEASAHASLSEEVKKIDYIENNNYMKIDVTSIDDYCSEHNIKHIDFIKIDTEGYEKEVIEGAKYTIEFVKPKYIQIEFNWHQLFRNSSIYFFSEKLKNYNVYQLTYNSMRKVNPKNPLSNIYLFSNFIFVRKDIFIN